MIFQIADKKYQPDMNYVISVLELHKKGLEECRKIFIRSQSDGATEYEKRYHLKIDEIDIAISRLRSKKKDVKRTD